MDFLDWLLNAYLTYYNSDNSNEEEEEDDNLDFLFKQDESDSRERGELDLHEQDEPNSLTLDDLEKIATDLINGMKANKEEGNDEEEEDDRETCNCEERVDREHDGSYLVGWVCPMCGTVVSPYVHTCPHCSAGA